MDELTDKLEFEKGHACKKPWTEYELEMRRAGEVIRNSMGSYAWDNEYAQIKGYIEGYLSGVAMVSRNLDL